LADAIQERFDIAPRLIKSKGGAFEVHLDGKLVFSKKTIGRFPDEGEIEDAMGEQLSA